MSEVIKKLLFAFVALLSLAACERDGLDRDAIYKSMKFGAISNIRGEGGYGEAVLRWNLPDSSYSLFCVELSWQAEGQEVQKQIIPSHDDSIVIAGLEPLEYTFHFVSRGIKGELEEGEDIKLKITDWQLEPPAEILDFKGRVVENFLLLSWVNPQQRTFDRVVFELYKNGTLDRTVETDTTYYEIEDLDYHTGYVLKYYSVNARNIRSQERVLEFETGLKAPDVPEILNDNSRIDYAYCADITWTPAPDLDSLEIVFPDLDGNEREYRFKAAGGKGYLSMLPGGTVELKISAKGTNGAWSKVVKQKIKTRLGAEMYLFRDGNYPPNVQPSGKTNKIVECITNSAMHNNGPLAFDYMVKPTYTFIEVHFKPLWIDELENLVRLKQIRVSGQGMPETASDYCPDIQQFLDLADRLPFLNELIVNKKYKLFKQLKAAFAGHPKVKFTAL